MKVENLTLIEKLKKIEKRLHEIERSLVLMERKLDEYENTFQQKNKSLEEVQDHFFIPHVQIFG
jgi:prefoldin subunit 5